MSISLGKRKDKNFLFKDFLKRLFDIVLGYTGFFVFSPIFTYIMLLIYLEDGLPVFFLKDCVGLQGKEFKQIKFRSMIKDAERYTGPVWATKSDARITRIGRFLRKTALDELPQLFNILKGQMSFVGPRPQRKVFVNEYLKKISNYIQRFKVRPGLTGPAQVNLTYDASVEEKLKADIWYVENYNLLLDIKLILRSFWLTLKAGWERFKE